MNKILISVCLCMVVLTGCTETEKTSPAEKKGHAEKHLLLGLIPERNIFEQIERYEPLAAYLSEKTGAKIELQVLTRYGNIIDNFVSMNLDGAFFGSFTYVLAHAKLGVEVLARPESTDGVSTYYGLIFTRKDSNIKTVHDMQGKVFACVDEATTAGHLLPLAFFKEHGIKDYKTFFRENYFAGTHEDSIKDVLNKRADIGAAKNTVFYDLAKNDRRIMEELTILKRSPDVPSNGLAVRRDLDTDVKMKLKKALLNMHHDQDGKRALEKINAAKFIETTDDDYAAIYKYINEIQLNLATYDYIND